MTKRGLGRGLEVLIPVDEAQAGGVQDVPLEAITPNPHQPRSAIMTEDLQELAGSIREHGIIQPLIVTRKADGGYQLIAGERRWRAARLAGLQRVPVIVKDVAPQQMLELALVENVQRADLNPLEEALAYKQLIEEFGLSQGEVAQRVGKSRPAIANTLRLLQASPAVQAAVMEGTITEGHARALLGLPRPEDQDAALRIVIQQGLNVRQVEALVQQFARPPKPKPAPLPEVQALEESFEAALGTRVRLKTGRKGGRVVIYYYSDEEFQALYERLTGERL
ncbi:MAG: ParB/RepB/Spo0J family partition protein [Anaerolineae bacterium]